MHIYNVGFQLNHISCICKKNCTFICKSLSVNTGFTNLRGNELQTVHLSILLFLDDAQ